METKNIKLSQIVVIENVRTNANGIAELADNIKQIGLLHPILVREGDKENEFILLGGNRRLKAVTELNWKEIPANVYSKTESIPDRVVQLISNQTKPMTATDTADTIFKLCTEDKMSHKDIGRVLSMNKKRVEFFLRLHHAPDIVRESVNAGELPEDAADVLLSEPPVNVNLLIPQIVREYETEEKGQVRRIWDEKRDIRDAIKNYLRQDMSRCYWKKDDTDLLPQVPPCASCPKRTTVNKTLFGEGDQCTDLQCYKDKGIAWTERMKTEKQVQFILADEWMQLEGVEILHSHQITEDIKNIPTELVKKGVVIDGKRKGKVVEFCLVSDIPKRPATPQAKAKAQKERKQKQFKKEYAWLRIQNIAKQKTTWPEVCKLVAEGYFRWCSMSQARNVFKALGKEVPEKDVFIEFKKWALNQEPATLLNVIVLTKAVEDMGSPIGQFFDSIAYVEKTLGIKAPAEPKPSEKKPAEKKSNEKKSTKKGGK